MTGHELPPPRLEDIPRKRLYARALKLRCPRCGEGALSSILETPAYCVVCGSIHAREPGYWMNAVVINYVVSGLTGLGLYFGVLQFFDLPVGAILVICGVAAVVVSVIASPFSRTLWLASDLAVSDTTDDDFIQTYAGDDRRLRKLAAKARKEMLEARGDL